MRTFERTHPWISFRLDLRNAKPAFWILLGEAASKCEHIAGVPLRPSVAQNLHRLYLAKGVLATTAIEGNTLTEKEVLQHLDGKLHLPTPKQYLTQEIDNIVNACNQIGALLAGGDTCLTPERLREFNRWVLNRLPPEGQEVPGGFRDYSVLVGNVYRGAPAADCPYLVQRLCDWLAGEDFLAPPGMEMIYALIKAVVAHVYFAWIHPFGNGNGRTARLLELQILLAAGVPSPAAHLLSNHYNLTRPEYYRQLDLASKTGGDLRPFIQYALGGFVDGLREQLRLIRQQQWDVAWRSYVHTKFRDRTGPSAQRLRDLVLDLSESSEPVPARKIPELSARMARAYATKSSKTLQRDLVELERELALIRKTDQGFLPNREAILAFLPWRKTGKPS